MSKPKEQSFRELVQNFVMGVEFYVRTDGKRGHSPEKATEYIISNLQKRLERVMPKEEIRPESGPNRNGTSQAVRKARNKALKEVKAAIKERILE